MARDDTAITKALDEVFHQATMRHVMNELRRPEDFERANSIVKAAAEQRQTLEQDFQATFDQRFEAERQRLLETSTHLDLNHPAPSGMPRNTGYGIDQTARRNVVLAHEVDLQRADAQANRALHAVMDQARAREARQGDAARDFTQATDRRQTPDRRRPSRDQ